MNFKQKKKVQSNTVSNNNIHHIDIYKWNSSYQFREPQRNPVGSILTGF